MKQRKSILERVVHGADLGTEPLPKLPLAEVAGEHRVLIENHHGVIQYSCEEVLVKVNFGNICVCGTELELAQMTREQLVITGNIDSIRLIRGMR